MNVLRLQAVLLFMSDLLERVIRMAMRGRL